jgi:hypothetical protein
MAQPHPDTRFDSAGPALPERERQFLLQFPEFAHYLDEPSVRAHLERRLSEAKRLEDPVPHVVIHDLFDTGFYRMLAAAWPPLDLFKRDKHGRKYDLVPTSPAAASDPRNAGYERLPAELRAVWDFFVFTVNRRIVGPLLARMFEPELQARIGLIREAFEAGRITYQMAGSSDWTYRANVGRFMVRGGGYDLKPHVDSMPYLLTVLHYFPDEGQDEGFGTVFYKPERPLDFDACVRDGSTQHFDEAGINCEEALRIPFRPNTLLAFPNTLSSAHGAGSPTLGLRKVFQYHLTLKGDHEKV